MGHQPIVRKFYDDGRHVVYDHPSSRYSIFLYEGKSPQVKIICNNLDALNMKVEDLMCKNISLNRVTGVSHSLVTFDPKYDIPVVTWLKR